MRVVQQMGEETFVSAQLMASVTRPRVHSTRSFLSRMSLAVLNFINYSCISILLNLLDKIRITGVSSYRLHLELFTLTRNKVTILYYLLKIIYYMKVKRVVVTDVRAQLLGTWSPL